MYKFIFIFYYQRHFFKEVKTVYFILPTLINSRKFYCCKVISLSQLCGFHCKKVLFQTGRIVLTGQITNWYMTSLTDAITIELVRYNFDHVSHAPYLFSEILLEDSILIFATIVSHDLKCELTFLLEMCPIRKNKNYCQIPTQNPNIKGF